jgi:hypothetical protein
MAKKLQSHTGCADGGQNTCEKQLSEINKCWISQKNVVAPWLTEFSTLRTRSFLDVTPSGGRSCEECTGESHIFHLFNIRSFLT